jgi:signal transduction histidine kinase
VPWQAPTKLDVLAALVVLVLGIAEAATGQLVGPSGLGYLSVLVYTGCLLLRRTSLWAAVLLAFGTVVVTYTLGLSQEDYLASIVACLVLLAWVGFSFGLLEALLGLGFGFVCVASTNDPTSFGNDAWLLLVMGGSWAAGRALRSRRLLIEDLRRTTAELERNREELASRAVAEERLRIAQEIHDVVAHSVTVMLVQAEAAERVLPDHPDAQQAVAAVQDTGRQAITELRQLLGVLRPGEGRSGVTPQPGLGDLGVLVASYRETGLTIRHHGVSRVRPLPANLELTAFRVAQEALTNVLRHSCAREAAVDVQATDTVLRVEVVDPGPRKPIVGPRGHGLDGMRERVAACGGTLEAGPLGEGFKVSAMIPLETE